MIDLVAENKLPKVLWELPLTPMIDVVFLLIIFFVSIQFREIAGQLEARLPRSPGVVRRLAPQEETVDHRVWVRIECPASWKPVSPLAESSEESPVDRAAQPVLITVNGQPLADYDALQYELIARKFLLEAEGKTPLVILDLDPRLLFQNVVSALNAAKKAKLPNVSFTPPADRE